MDSVLLSISQTQAALSIKRSMVYRLIEEGKLKKVKLGRRTLITSESVKQLAS